MVQASLYGSLVVAVASLIFAVVRRAAILKQDSGTETMQEIAVATQQGAMAFLRREYSVLVIFAIGLTSPRQGLHAILALAPPAFVLIAGLVLAAPGSLAR